MAARPNDSASTKGARYSALHSTSQCPLWGWLVYNKKLSGSKNSFAKLGIAVHEFLEAYGKHCLATKQDTDYTAADEMKFKFMTGINEDQTTDYMNIIETIKSTFNWSEKISNGEVFLERRLAVNSAFEPISENDPNPYLSGGIDVIHIVDNDDEKMALVEDYKTVRSIYTQQFMVDSLQRIIYSALVFAHFPEVNIVAFTFSFVRYGAKHDPIYMSREELEDVHLRIREEIARFQEVMAEKEQPEPCAGAHCVLCENKGHCPAYKNAYHAEDQINDVEDAKRVYQNMRLCGVRAKELETSLKTWIDQNGNVTLKYEEYGPQPYEKTEFNDLAKLIELLKNAGVPLGAIYEQMSLSKTGLDKILKKAKLQKDATLKASIDGIASTSPYTKFMSKKIGEKEQDGDES